MATKPGLYANIHAKQERIKREKAEGKPVEKMRKPGTKGAPTKEAFIQSAKTAKPRVDADHSSLCVICSLAVAFRHRDPQRASL